MTMLLNCGSEASMMAWTICSKGRIRMLPKGVFEQVTRAMGVRGEVRPNERRAAMRIPIRGQATVHRMIAAKVAEGSTVRLKDISQGGVSMLTAGRSPVSGEFLLRMQAPTSDTQIWTGLWIWCLLRRQTEFDRTCTVSSATFLKLLLPGQVLAVGRDVNSVKWLDVEGDVVPADGEVFTADSRMAG